MTPAERRRDEAISEIRAAIFNSGRVPSYHSEVMAKHRREWPTLWHALDKLISVPIDEQ